MPVRVLHSKSEVDTLLQKSTQLVVMKCGAKWCGPCKTMGPVFYAFSEKHKDIVCVEIDADELSEVVEEYHVSALPTFLCLKKKKVVSTIKAVVQPAAFESAILSHK